jgi:hypothetical protein
MVTEIPPNPQGIAALQVSKNGLFAPFIYKNEHYTKTGSGQTLGKLKKVPFSLRCSIS